MTKTTESQENTSRQRIQGEESSENRHPSNKKRNLFERVVHVTVYCLMFLLLAVVVFLSWQRFIKPAETHLTLQTNLIETEVQVDETPEESGEKVTFDLSPIPSDMNKYDHGIPRMVLLDTTIPSRRRVDVITYTVQSGESLFSIADKFSIKPETILWGNYETLQDNPHLISTDQALNILPINGTYYQWQEGDKLGAVASFFGVEPEAIIEYSGNRFDLTKVDPEGSNIEADTWLIVPGGKRALKDWGPPAISRNNPASASYYGPGHCGSVYEGAMGTGTFVWPTPSHYISGYNYVAGIHPAIDLAGDVGNAIFATDSGVVVYAGWSNYGYGYLIVIDHGNGWQSAYAHLSSVGVFCGQSVFQGSVIGGLGSTGNSSGPHLHFELVYQGTKPNPLNFLP